MTEPQQSDALKNLVIFIMALAILGTIIALAWYFAVDLPIQQAAALNVPTNQYYCKSVTQCINSGNM